MGKNLKIESNVSKEEKDYLNDKLAEFNASKIPFTQSPDFIHLDYLLKDDNAKICGGIIATAYSWKILYVDVLWLDEKYRKQGYGTKLLEAVEMEAIKLGCSLSHLDTFDFQAKDFYMKHGYSIFGVLDECPPQHKRYYLKKILTKPS